MLFRSIRELRDFGGTIIMALDTDKAGQQGVNKFDTMRKKYRMDEFRVVWAPEGDDWNDLHKRDVDLSAYVLRNVYTPDWKHKITSFLSKL